MICNKYDSLSHYDKVQFMGKLCHASQSDDVLFEIANEIIRQGEIRGLFEKVSFPTTERRDLLPDGFVPPSSIKDEILKRWKEAPIVGEPNPKTD